MIEIVAKKVSQGIKLNPPEQTEFERLLLDSWRSNANVLATNTGGTSRSATYRRLVVDGDLYVPAGVIKVGPDGKGNVVISGGGIKLKYGSTTKIDLQTDGDVFIGDDTTLPAKTYISIFSAAQTYNGEAVGAGDMLWGDNTASKANMLWDKSAGELLFRGGTTGNIKIDTAGILTFNADGNSYLVWKSAAGVFSASILAVSGLLQEVAGGTGNDGVIRLYTVDAADVLSTRIDISGGAVNSIVLTATTVSLAATTLTLTGNIDMATAKWIGLSASAGRLLFTDDTADTITVDDADLLIETTRYVGIGAAAGRLVFTDAATDQLAVMSANFGIGIAAPTVALHIGDRTAAGQANMFLSNGASARAFLAISDANTAGLWLGAGNSLAPMLAWDAGTFTMKRNVTYATGPDSTGSNVLRIDTAGDVELGDYDVQNGRIIVNPRDTATGANLRGLIVRRSSSNTPAASFGTSISFQLESTTTLRDAAEINALWVVATDASRTGRFTFTVDDSAGTREGLRIQSSGTAAMVGFLGAAAVVRQTVGAAAPAGGTGATAGAYDTAANRNAMITLLNNIRTAGVNLGLWAT